MSNTAISDSVINRLPRYYRYLGDLMREGITKISSADLSKRMKLTASQIRQDLNCFGGFGQQGYGYNVKILHEEIGNILDLYTPKKLIVVGMGNLGKALSQHIPFEAKGFQLVGLFDVKESLVGQMVRNVPIRNFADIDEFCREFKPTAAIITTPRDVTQEVANRLIRLGVTGLLNFTHYDIAHDHPDVTVQNIHLGDSLMTLSYSIKTDTPFFTA